MSGERSAPSYRAAGVDIEAAEGTLPQIGRLARRTHGPEVLAGIGHFGGCFRLAAAEEVALVSTADSVGTKVLLAGLLGRHRGIGVDLVNHCVNDLLATGARPLFFLDYYATPDLEPDAFLAIVDGIAEACLAAGCALVGGETAELPGVYRPGAYDLAGFMVGRVAPDRIVTGEAIQAGDVLLGLPSAGLHTNGFSLARVALGLDGEPDVARARASVRPDWSGQSLGELLLTSHRSYLAEVTPLLEEQLIHGLAHVTGGGLAGNVGRVIPEGLTAEIDCASWTIPPLFHLIQQSGDIATSEMYRVFNMGIGFVLAVAAANAERVHASIPEAWLIGSVTADSGPQRARLRGVEERRGPL